MILGLVLVVLSVCCYTRPVRKEQSSASSLLKIKKIDKKDVCMENVFTLNFLISMSKIDKGFP